MKIRVLGSAAGGGFPQWNCNCPNCRSLRAGTFQGRARTQSSIVVSNGDANAWTLVNASPDILAQLRNHPDLQPARAIRDTALRSIVLCDSQVDHTTGLYMLRESKTPWKLWCTDNVFADLTRDNPVLKVLGHFCGVERQTLAMDVPFTPEESPGLTLRAIPVAGKPAPYSPNRDAPKPGDNVALLMEDAYGGRAFYAPGLAEIDDTVWQAMSNAACVLVDGTFWTDDEMVQLGVSTKRARDIGHLPQSGPGGMLEWFERLPSTVRKILIHINNTNPILDESSPQSQELRRRGVEVAYDGQEIVL